MPKKENDTSAIGKNTYFASLLAGFLLAIATPAQAATVKYTELNERLPYDELITIVGNLSDFKRGKTKVQDIMDIQSITLRYQVEGLAEKLVNAEVTTDGRWQVVLEKLPEKSQVVFTFQIKGQLSEEKTKKVVGQLIKDTEFKIELRRYIDSSAEKDYAAKAYYAGAFAKAIVSTVNRYLPKVEPSSYENLRRALARRILYVEFRKDDPNRKSALELTESELKETKSELKGTIQKDILVEANLSSISETKEVKKYYGIDIGAIHLPKLDELRSFSTLNIYFGAAEATPEPLSFEPWESCKTFLSWGESAGRFLWKRSSLTVGFSLNDISGGSQSDIKGNNAFLVGHGFRINRYFRITTGASLYRVATQNGDVEDRMLSDDLRCTFFWGLSIDIVRLEILQNLIGGTLGTNTN